MARLLSIFSCVLLLNYQVKSQMLRSPLLNRLFTDTIIEAPRNYIEAPCNYADAPRNYIEAPRAYTDAPRNYFDIPIDARNYANAPRIIEAPRNYIQTQPTVIEQPCNGILPSNNIPGATNMAPSTTIITDCTPSVCQNLANTINLMVVSSLLQNTIGGEQAALQLAGPYMKDLIFNTGVAGGFSNPISNFVNPNSFVPNGYVPNLVAVNGVAPNFLAQNVISPNLLASNVYGPTPVAPRVVASPNNGVVYPNNGVVYPNNGVVYPNNGVVYPNAAMNNGALLSSLLQLLGNQG